MCPGRVGDSRVSEIAGPADGNAISRTWPILHTLGENVKAIAEGLP